MPLFDVDELIENSARVFINRDAEDVLGGDAGEPTLKFWDDDEDSDEPFWALGRDADHDFFDRLTATSEERELSEKTYAASTPGSAGAFRAADAATMPSPGDWYEEWGGGASGDLSGFIPTKALTPIEGGVHYMRPDAAKAYKAMQRAAKKAGVNFSVTDSYRDFAAQERLKKEKPSLAATPGKSNHGWGTALDVNVNEPKVYEWLKKNGRKYGFDQPMDYEPWHWEYTRDANHPRVRSDGRLRKPKPKPKKERAEVKAVNPVDYDDPFASFSSAMPLLALDLVDEVQGIRIDQGKRPRASQDLTSVERQMRKGFLEAGRPDLARMVGSKAFSIWVDKESGWNRSITSAPNNQGLPNDGYFQVWRGHSYNANGEVSQMTAREQAYLIATKFALTAEDIKRYAKEIRQGSYVGWG